MKLRLPGSGLGRGSGGKGGKGVVWVCWASPSELADSIKPVAPCSTRPLAGTKMLPGGRVCVCMCGEIARGLNCARWRPIFFPSPPLRLQIQE